MTGTGITMNAGSKDNNNLESLLVSRLSRDEREVAARASYDYLCNPAAKESEQDECAQEFARRYLRSTSDPEKALKRIKATLAFRRKIDIDGLRQAFDKNNKTSDNSTPRLLKEHLQNKSLYVQGYDKDGRSTYVFVTRNVHNHDQEWTIKSHVYTLERALACSKADDGTVNAVIDFKGFSYQNAPPMQIGQQFMTTFREHYAGAIHQIFLIDAPMAFYMLWKVMQNFVGTKTRDKIHFVSSSSSSDEEPRLTDHYDKDQLAPWMMEGGTNDREFDLDEYLHKSPFDMAFGEETIPEQQ